LRELGYEAIYIDPMHKDFIAHTNIEELVNKLAEAASEAVGIAEVRLATLAIDAVKWLISRWGRGRVAVLVDDVLVFDVGKIPKHDLLRSILGSFRLLYGEGRYLLEYAKYLGDPTFEEARASLKAALDYFELSKRTEDPLVRDRHLRVAFNTLFHAARSASMVYLSTDISRLIGGKLTEPYKTIFNEFINTLHIKYFYNGEYPRENIEEEFSRWVGRVEEYISKLELEVKTKRK
jgi:hypothetical protein